MKQECENAALHRSARCITTFEGIQLSRKLRYDKKLGRPSLTQSFQSAAQQ